jgi:hypothetical protein
VGLDALAALSRLAADQHGTFTTTQALELGVSRHQLQWAVHRQICVPVHRGVHRFVATPLTWHGRLVAAALAGRAVVSHRAAAALWQLSGFAPGPVEVTRRRGKHFRPPDVVSHESRDLHLAAVVQLDGVPTTGIARTLVDLGQVVRTGRVEEAVDDAIRRRLLTVDDLWACVIDHSRRGRDGVGVMRAILEERTPVGSVDSRFERLFLRSLGATAIPAPIVQHEVYDARGFVARVDLAWPSSKVAVELDGKAFHLNAAAFEDDARKRNRLRLDGWIVLVITWKMFTEQPFRVWQDIRQALDGDHVGPTVPVPGG